MDGGIVNYSFISIPSKKISLFCIIVMANYISVSSVNKIRENFTNSP
jgi:hypothetical protein